MFLEKESPSEASDGPVSYTHLDVYKRQHLSNGQLVTDSLIRFDAATDPEHPWFRGTGENDLAPITDENWSEDEIYSAAASLPITITPFADASEMCIRDRS